MSKSLINLLVMVILSISLFSLPSLAGPDKVLQTIEKNGEHYSPACFSGNTNGRNCNVAIVPVDGLTFKQGFGRADPSDFAKRNGWGEDSIAPDKTKIPKGKFHYVI